MLLTSILCLGVGLSERNAPPLAAETDDERGLIVGAPLDAPVPRMTSSATISLVSNYVFRGLTQTHGNAALQAGLGWSHASGWHAGLWGSNVSWFSDANPTSSASLELDLFAGYAGAFAEDWTYDVGLLRYEYPGRFRGLSSSVTEPNTTEAFVALAWKGVSAKYSTSLGDTFGVPESAGSSYLDLTATLELPAQLTLGLHGGLQEYRGRSNGAANDRLFSYADWSLSLSREVFAGFVLALTYTDSDAEDAGYTIQGENIGDGQWVVSLVKSF